MNSIQNSSNSSDVVLEYEQQLPDGTHVKRWTDGTQVYTYANGMKTIHFVDGSIETHTSDCVVSLFFAS